MPLELYMYSSSKRLNQEKDKLTVQQGHMVYLLPLAHKLWQVGCKEAGKQSEDQHTQLKIPNNDK